MNATPPRKRIMLRGSKGPAFQHKHWETRISLWYCVAPQAEQVVSLGVCNHNHSTFHAGGMKRENTRWKYNSSNKTPTHTTHEIPLYSWGRNSWCNRNTVPFS